MFDDVIRSRHKRMIGGVCGGIAAHYGVHVGVVRLVFILMFAPGIPLYLLLWASTPAEGQPQVRKPSTKNSVTRRS